MERKSQVLRCRACMEKSCSKFQVSNIAPSVRESFHGNSRVIKCVVMYACINSYRLTRSPRNYISVEKNGNYFDRSRVIPETCITNTTNDPQLHLNQYNRCRWGKDNNWDLKTRWMQQICKHYTRNLRHSKLRSWPTTCRDRRRTLRMEGHCDTPLHRFQYSRHNHRCSVCNR